MMHESHFSVISGEPRGHILGASLLFSVFPFSLNSNTLYMHTVSGLFYSHHEALSLHLI